MKKIILLGLITLVLMATGAKADCTYQEDANLTSIPNPSNWMTPPWNATMIFDGNWSTYGHSSPSWANWEAVYANYTVPPGANNTGSTWQIKYGSGPFYGNLSLSSCDFSTGTAAFKIESEDQTGESEQGTRWSCYNFTTDMWTLLLENSSTQEPPDESRARVYEDAMYWGDCGGGSGPPVTTTTSTSTTSTTSTSTTTTIPSTTTTAPYNFTYPCSVCPIGNLAQMGMGGLVWAPICGFLNIMFCAPILFAIGLVGMAFIGAFIVLRKP